MLQRQRSPFPRFLLLALPLLLATSPILAMPVSNVSLEQDDADKIREEIMKIVKERMRRDRQELMREIEETLSKIVKETGSKKGGTADELEAAHRTIVKLQRRIEELTAQLERARGDNDDDHGDDDNDRGAAEPAILGFAFEQTDGGIRVTRVLPNSPAATIFKAGDIITEIDGKKATEQRFTEHMSGKRPGERVSLSYQREVNGRKREMAARPKLVSRSSLAAQIERLMAGALEEEPAPEAEVAPSKPAARPKLGITVRDENFELTLLEVEANSNCAEAGLRAGDILLAVNGNKVTTLESLGDAAGQLRVGKEAMFRFKRGASIWETTVVLGGGDRRPVLKGRKEISAPKNDAGGNAAPAARGYLGVVLDGGDSLTISEIDPGSAADKMGIRAGDVITHMNGKALSDVDDLRGVLGKLKAGDEIRVKVKRGGSQESLRGSLGRRPEQAQARPQVTPSATPAAEIARVRPASSARTAATTTPAATIASSQRPVGLGITAELEAEEVKVITVFEGSAAAQAGMQVGDKLMRVNGVALHDLDALESAVKGKAAGDSVRFRVMRNGTGRRVDLVLAPLPALAVQAMGATPSATPKAQAAKSTKPVYLGVELEESEQQGLSVAVVLDGPCKASGWRQGDQLISFGGKALKTLDDMRHALGSCTVGESVSAELQRAGQIVKVDVKLVPRAE